MPEDPCRTKDFRTRQKFLVVTNEDQIVRERQIMILINYYKYVLSRWAKWELLTLRDVLELTSNYLGNSQVSMFLPPNSTRRGQSSLGTSGCSIFTAPELNLSSIFMIIFCVENKLETRGMRSRSITIKIVYRSPTDSPHPDILLSFFSPSTRADAARVELMYT